MYFIFCIYMSSAQQSLYSIDIPKSKEKFCRSWSHSLDTRIMYVAFSKFFPSPFFPLRSNTLSKKRPYFSRQRRGGTRARYRMEFHHASPGREGSCGVVFPEQSWAPFYSCRPNSKRAIGARTTMECSSACSAARSDPLSLSSSPSPPLCLRSSRTSWTVGRSSTSPW